ncbi:sodium-dependent bicarbonate transport family permease [Rhodocaloribacter litoris]|uniref:sodium-dependent bicarbonate transport family permease n=1 Tax=Rhodocaloribacter litoris TaxID=2558931 RepID=UPI0014214ABA|nr:sodium-dependent bicarbonate transport family permease [Rhodocaloribacter litoris]QXD16340.1 sodium-dependent bicarbonate transport family permease [Rhodocaloribacter litoris]
MEHIDALAANLLSPIILSFVLGVIASLVRSDLRLPDALYQALSIYLLLAIGLKGGVELHKTPLLEFLGPALLTLFLGLLTPVIAYNVLRRLGRFDRVNAAAIAAHYGSVSAVTFIVAISFGTMIGHTPEGFMPALVAILEVPAIVVALMIAFTREKRAGSWRDALHEVLAGRSVVLLAGGLLIGLAVGPEKFEPVSPFFVSGFQGALALFLLEMGILAARRLQDLREVGLFLVGFGILIPIVHGLLAAWLGGYAGLSLAGRAVLAAMVSSASYIAAPAAVRIALPEANPTFYLTASLGITFPFNVMFGIPLYYTFATWLAG